MVKIPLNIDTKTNVIVLDILLKGSKNSRFIKAVLDTGASITTVPSEIALSIGCDPSRPKKRMEIITASGTEYVPIITIPKIQFLGFELKDIEAACLNLPPKSLVSGLLGLNVLKHFNISLKLLRKELEFNQ